MWRGEEVGLADRIFVSVRAGDQAAERIPIGGSRTSVAVGNAEEYRSRLKANGLSGNINTSFVERANLTIRQSMSKLTRRTWDQLS